MCILTLFILGWITLSEYPDLWESVKILYVHIHVWTFVLSSWDTVSECTCASMCACVFMHAFMYICAYVCLNILYPCVDHSMCMYVCNVHAYLSACIVCLHLFIYSCMHAWQFIFLDQSTCDNTCATNLQNSAYLCLLTSMHTMSIAYGLQQMCVHTYFIFPEILHTYISLHIRAWSLQYMAPEIVLNKGHGKEVDWWSLGVLVYEVTQPCCTSTHMYAHSDVYMYMYAYTCELWANWPLYLHTH